MLATLTSATLLGISAQAVSVEVSADQVGEPRLIVVGLPDAAVKESRDRVCAAADLRAGFARRGIACFRPDLSDFQYLRGGFVGLPGTQVRRLLLTRGAVWAATTACWASNWISSASRSWPARG